MGHAFLFKDLRTSVLSTNACPSTVRFTHTIGGKHVRVCSCSHTPALAHTDACQDTMRISLSKFYCLCKQQASTRPLACNPCANLSKTTCIMCAACHSLLPAIHCCCYDRPDVMAVTPCCCYNEAEFCCLLCISAGRLAACCVLLLMQQSRLTASCELLLPQSSRLATPVVCCCWCSKADLLLVVRR